jgi:hypothetical protein
MDSTYPKLSHGQLITPSLSSSNGTKKRQILMSRDNRRVQCLENIVLSNAYEMQGPNANLYESVTT